MTNEASQDNLQEEALISWFAGCPGAVVAYSGGVDSAVISWIAHSVLGDRCLAVTADSPSLARSELDTACRVADQIGIPHRVVQTSEGEDPNYLKNDSQRCFYCKSHLYRRLAELPEVTRDGWWMLSGTNRDDLGDWRPGLKAANNYSVRSPLAELGIGKSGVRRLAARWGLTVSEKPASPCLASRLAYGVEVTPDRLSMVENAEKELRAIGFTHFRVRLHPDEFARIEVPSDQLAKLIDPTVRLPLVARLRELGFRFVSLDLEGFTSGSLNRLVQIQASP